MTTQDSSSNSDPQPARRMRLQTVKAASRAMSILINLIAWGVAGAFLDRWFGTSLWVVVGIVLGMGLAMIGLLSMAREADRLRREASRRDGDPRGSSE